MDDSDEDTNDKRKHCDISCNQASNRSRFPTTTALTASKVGTVHSWKRSTTIDQSIQALWKPNVAIFHFIHHTIAFSYDLFTAFQEGTLQSWRLGRSPTQDAIERSINKSNVDAEQTWLAKLRCFINHTTAFSNNPADGFPRGNSSLLGTAKGGVEGCNR